MLRMPELPEVETTRRALEPELKGRRVEAVSVNHPRVARRQMRPADLADRLTDRRVLTLRRHGKFLLFDLEDDLVWVTHLGMSGRIQMVDGGTPDETHTRVAVGLDNGRDLRFVDPRTFGFMAVFTPDELSASTLGRLGPDAYTELPASPRISATLSGRTAPIKALLLDQSVLAGIGNIYADESLHRAALDPLREGGTLTGDEVKALRASIKRTLESGLRWGGTSLDDLAYLLPDGRAGRYLSRLRAYGREGEACHRCGSEIRRTVIRGRSSFWCPGCQV
jgi:formamidopyrimidine-DNA glycosylase